MTTVFDDSMPVLLDGGRKINVISSDRDGRRQTRSEEVDSKATPERKPRLVILTLGADAFPAGGFPPILHADRDARDLADFFKAHLVAPIDGARFDDDWIEMHTFSGAEARADRVLERFELLRFRDEPLGKDDLVCVVVESHFVGHARRGLLLTADSAVSVPPARRSRPTLSARDWGRWPTRAAR